MGNVYTVQVPSLSPTNNTGAFTVVGGGGGNTLKDGSDSTYLQKAVATIYSYVSYPVDTINTTAFNSAVEVPWRVRGRWRISRTTGATVKLYIGTQSSTGANKFATSDVFTGAGTSPSTVTGKWYYPNTWALSTAAAKAQDFDYTRMVTTFADNEITGTTARTNWYEAYVDIECTSIPTVGTITAAGGPTITNSSFPIISWVFSDTDSWAQTQWYVFTVDSATYSAAGYDPTLFNVDETAGPINFVGARDIAGDTTQVNSYQLNTALPNGTYRSYVKVGKTVNGTKVYATLGYVQYDLSTVPPALPTTAGAFDAANNRVILSVAGHTNLLADDDASFEATIGNWVNDVNATIVRTTAQHTDGIAAMQMTAASAATMSAKVAVGAKESVSPGATYSVVASFKTAATSRSCRVGVIWLDSGSTVISTTWGALVTDVSGSWTVASGTLTAPNNALYGQITVQVQSPANAEVHFVDKIALYPGVSAGSVNLCTNPSAETDIADWGPFFSDPITVARSTIRSTQGTASFLMTSTSTADAMAGVNCNTMVVGLQYTVSADIYIPSGGTTSVTMSWAFAPSSTVAVVNTYNAWVRISATFTFDGTHHFVGFVGDFSAAGQTFFVDGVQIEQNSIATAFSLPSPSWSPGGYNQATMTATVERSNDLGVTWAAVYGTPVALDPITQMATVYDYEADRGGNVLYRVRQTAVRGINTLTTDYPPTLTVAVTNDGLWWLKASANPALNLGDVGVQVGTTEDITEQVGIFYPIGADAAIVVSSGVYKTSGTFTVITTSEAAYLALLNMLNFTGRVCMQDPFGEQKIIRFTQRTITASGTSAVPVNTHAISYVEVD